MLRNAILDAKICEYFAKISQDFDRVLPGLLPFEELLHVRAHALLLGERQGELRHGHQVRCAAPRTPSLFPGLVLGWINADVHVQIRILQHFSRSIRKSYIASKSAKVLQNTSDFYIFCKILGNLLN